MPAKPKWQRLYELVLSEKVAARLAKRVRFAEIAMTSAVQEMLNGSGTRQDFDELLEAMRRLYEHRLSQE